MAVRQSLKISATTICWTDSMTVLHWLNSAPNRWKPFVANRVAKVQQTAGMHVPGSDNPADDISRGLTPEKLLVCERWWHGPHWLARNTEEWPQNTPSREKHSVHFTTDKYKDVIDFVQDLES